jgi:hypothetical protein
MLFAGESHEKQISRSSLSRLHNLSS